MDIYMVKEALASLLGLPKQVVVEGKGPSAKLSSLAFSELSGLVNLPTGYRLTHKIGRPARGDYFLDLDSLVENERVVIYKATGVVKSINLILRRQLTKEGSPSVEFDFLVCMLQGGQASYKDEVVMVAAPVVDVNEKTAILHNGVLKLVSVTELRNVGGKGLQFSEWTKQSSDALDSLTFKFGDPSVGDSGPHANRFNITFDDDEEEDEYPPYGLN